MLFLFQKRLECEHCSIHMGTYSHHFFRITLALLWFQKKQLCLCLRTVSTEPLINQADIPKRSIENPLWQSNCLLMIPASSSRLSLIGLLSSTTTTTIIIIYLFMFIPSLTSLTSLKPKLMSELAQCCAPLSHCESGLA